MMNSQVQVLDALQIDIVPEDIAQPTETKPNTKRIGAMAADVLARVQGKWRPRAIIRWLAVERKGGGGDVGDGGDGGDGMMVLRYIKDGVAVGEAACLNLGFSCSLMASAHYGLAGVFTAGDELEKHAIRASKEKRYLEAYILDGIALAVLEKTRQHINRVVEEKAAEMNWGIGPFLSPGSVHGWELEDQKNLCKLLPLEKIGVTAEQNGIFTPFKTLSALVGIGPGFSEKTVGSPCDVCSRKERCVMRRATNAPSSIFL
ncbi:MAG: hypothetical protein ABR512_08435 [Desulfopila sp.]